MSWLSDIQVLDFSSDVRLHFTCYKCDYAWYVDLAKFRVHRELKYLYLDELSSHIICPIFGCNGKRFRISKPYSGKVEAFVAGMP